MDLYFILFAIAALGIIALALILTGQTKPKKIHEDKKEIDEESETNLDINTQPQNEPVSVSANRIEPTFSDSGLSSLGFSALDNLLDEPNESLLDPDFEEQNTKIQQFPLKRKANSDQGLITFFIMAQPNRSFAGYELLQALHSAGLNYGEMNIFHRYADDSDLILFSVASAVEPGIFDMANIGAFSCPGLSIFMPLQNDGDMLDILELLIETAEQLAEDLDGILYDQDHQPLTAEKLQHYRAICTVN